MHPQPVPTPPSFSVNTRNLLLAGLALLCGAATPARAFPPAPYYTLFGLVRDQTGNTLAADGAELILLRDGEEVGRTPILNALRPEHNYTLDMRIDTARSGSRSYTDKAVPARGLFSLAVSLGGELYHPVEVAGDLRAGVGGERVRLDLNLGADSDRDGLPDVWEQWQLYQLGEYPGSPGWDLSRVDKTGDLDGDGVDNFLEYVAGTFAGDATERFELKIRSLTPERAEFEFFCITGKVYTIEESSDLVNWKPVPFATTPDGARAVYFRAADVNILPAYLSPAPGGKNFYRLTVR